LQPNKATATGSLLAAGFCCAVRCGGGHRAVLVRTWKKRRADRSARRFSAGGEKKMEKEKERMHKTLGGGAVTRRRS